jgi:hypothetical protein
LRVDALAPEVLFGSERVVSRTAQSEVRRRMLASQGEWREVVKFEAMPFGATPSHVIDVSALLAVTVEDGASNRGGDVPPAPARNSRILSPRADWGRRRHLLALRS